MSNAASQFVYVTYIRTTPEKRKLPVRTAV